jgi:hypothetical protein
VLSRFGTEPPSFPLNKKKVDKMFNLKPEIRKAIYGLVAVAVPLLVAFGTISDVIGVQILNAVAAILAIGSSALAFNNVPKQD